MGIFRRNLPPKTTLENFTYIPHLERVLLWFLQNDKQMQIINSEAVHILFDGGIKPKCDEDNNPDILVKKINDPRGAKPIERWLILKTWLDLITIVETAKKLREDGKEDIPMTEIFEERIDYIEKQTVNTLITSGEIASKYNLDMKLNMNLENELSKIKTEKEKEIFKYNYLADSLISSEVRLLAWIYKELFNKDYQINK